MFNRSYVRTLLCVITLAATPTFLATAQAYTPENTAFAWDIDGVILKKPAKFGPVMRILAKGLVRLHLLKAYWYSTERRETAEEWAQFFEQHNSKDIADIVREIAYGKTQIDGTVTIIEELKALGYVQNAATNMGTKDFVYYDKSCPFFAYFMHKNTVDYANGLRIKKPNPAYFANYFATCPIEAQREKTIFIDDRKDNVEAATKAGMIGIQFKNPKQLRAELVNMGILPAEAPSATIAH